MSDDDKPKSQGLPTYSPPHPPTKDVVHTWFLHYSYAPWYIGVVLLVCTRHRMDYREKPGYVSCTIAAILATIAIIFSATKGAED